MIGCPYVCLAGRVWSAGNSGDCQTMTTVSCVFKKFHIEHGCHSYGWKTSSKPGFHFNNESAIEIRWGTWSNPWPQSEKQNNPKLIFTHDRSLEGRVEPYRPAFAQHPCRFSSPLYHTRLAPGPSPQPLCSGWNGSLSDTSVLFLELLSWYRCDYTNLYHWKECEVISLWISIAAVFVALPWLRRLPR